MSIEVMHTLEEEKEEIQKQLGCMDRIFLLFDRRYLLGQCLNGNHHKKQPQGRSATGNKFKNASDKVKNQNIMKESHRESVESSRNTFSSSCSSLDYSNQLQTVPSSFSTKSSTPNENHNLWASLLDSMTRKPRVVTVKTVAKDEQKGPKMAHVDSPRLLQQHANPVTYERRDQNLVKNKETSIPILRGVKDVKQSPRFSYDDRESPYKLKSFANLKNQPRLSLDSKHNNASVIDPRQTHEPGSNNRPASSLVARLMGLDLNCEALKMKPCLDAKTIPLEPAIRKQEVKLLVNKKVKQQVNKKVKNWVDHSCESVNDQIDNRFTETDLRILKHTLKPTNLTSDSMVITRLQKVKKVNPGMIQERNTASKGIIKTVKNKKQVSYSQATDSLTGTSPGYQWSNIKKQSNRHRVVSSAIIRNHLYMDNCQKRYSSEQSDAIVDSMSEPEVNSNGLNKDKFSERVIKLKPIAGQPSPVSVLDAFYTEDILSPIKKKPYAFKDYEEPWFDEREWSQVKTDDSNDQLTFGFNNIKFENIKQLVHQIELTTRTNDEPTINLLEGMNENHIYINEILSTSGFLKNLHLQPTSSLINPELFNILEKTKECTSKLKKIKRKLIFDIVDNNILTHILTRSACRWRETSRRITEGEKLLEELRFEINNLHMNKTGDLYELINFITEDVNKKRADWVNYCNEVPALVFNIEQLVFNDLITEIVNVVVSCTQ